MVSRRHAMHNSTAAQSAYRVGVNQRRSCDAQCSHFHMRVAPPYEDCSSQVCDTRPTERMVPQRHQRRVRAIGYRGYGPLVTVR
jgi:hypothetical protein